MYKFQTGPEPDHDRYEWVPPDDQCGSCGHANRECICGDVTEDEPVVKSFHQCYGHDERDGPPEEEEEREVEDDSDNPLNRSGYRRG